MVIMADRIQVPLPSLKTARSRPGSGPHSMLDARD